MKKKLITTTLSFLTILSMTTTVFGNVSTEDVLKVQNAQLNTIKDNMPQYTYINNTSDLNDEILESIEGIDIQETEKSLIDSREDAGKIIRKARNNSNLVEMDLTVEEAIYFMMYESGTDFDEDKKELQESLLDLKAQEYNVLLSIDSSFVPESSLGSNPNSKTLVDISPYVNYHTGIYSLEYAISALESAELMAEDSYQYTLDSLAINDNILKLNLLLSEKALKQQEVDLKRTELQYDLGLVSDDDLLQAKQDLNIATLELENLKKSYDNLKITLADTLGFKDTDIINLVYEPKLEPVDKTVEDYVDFHLKYSPALASARADKERAEKTYKLEETYYFDVSSTVEDDKEYAQDKSSDTASNIKSATYQSYNTLENLVNSLEIEKVNLELAQKTYEQTKLMYDLGYVSKSVLEQVELSVLVNEVTFETAKYNYDLEKFKLDNIFLTAN